MTGDHSGPGPLLGAWLEDPGPVTIGTTFRTILYVRPPDDRSVLQAVVELAFDLRMIYCVAVEPPPPGGPALSTDVTIGGGAATVTVTFREAITGASAEQLGSTGWPPSTGDYPAGVAVATVQWRCVGEGETHVRVREMTASTGPRVWELVLTQTPR